MLLWSDGDIRACHWLLDHTEADPSLSAEQQRALERYREDNLGAMIGYAQAKGCLRGKILRYFGETGEAGDKGCGACSVCVGEAALVGGDPLRAERAERAARRERQRAAFAGASAGAAGSFGARRVNRDGADDEELFQRLRALRKRIADEHGVPPYVVFSDATLRAMVRLRPKDEQELLSVSGVGEVKLRRYGAAFLKELGA